MAGRVGTIRHMWTQALEAQQATQQPPRDLSLIGAATPRLASQISASEGRGGAGAGRDGGGGRSGGGEPRQPAACAQEEPEADGFITVESEGASAHAPKPPSPPSTRPSDSSSRAGWGEVEDESEDKARRAAAFADRHEKEGVPEWVPRGGAGGGGNVRARGVSLASPRLHDLAATSLPLSARERDRYSKNPLSGAPPPQEGTRQAERGNGVAGVRGPEHDISIPELKTLVSSKLENLSSDREPGDTSAYRPTLPRGAGASGKRSEGSQGRGAGEGRGAESGSGRRGMAGAESTALGQTLADIRHLSGVEKARALGRGKSAALPGAEIEPEPWC
jgi:hypothetical protein